MPKVQIVIPCINLWEKYTKPCIESIKTKYDYRILIVDNASQDQTKAEAGKLVSHNFAHQRNEEAWCCSKSWNFGIQDGFDRGYDYILVLNNDVLLHPEAIDLLVERFEATKFSNKNLSKDHLLLRDFDTENLAMATMHDVRGECMTPAHIFSLSPEKKKEVPESEHPCFSGFMINKECWDKVGPFDENFKPAYFEDNDYHYRINLAGMKAIVLPTSLFYHYGNGTQREATPGQLFTSNMQFEKNRQYYQSKWGGLPGHEQYTKPFEER